MIYHITASDLSLAPSVLCLEQDFALCNEHTLVPHVHDTFQSDMLMIFFCLRGHLHMHANDNTLTLSEGDAYLCRPLTTIHGLHACDDVHVSVIFYSPHIADHMLPACQTLSYTLQHIERPIVHLGQELMSRRIIPLLDTLRQHAKDIRLAFYSSSLFHLFAILLFEVLNHACSPSRSIQKEVLQHTANRSDSIFNRFVQLLNADAGCHRTVDYYASQLCITPKHLSKVVKAKTATCALDIINRHAINLIKLDLMLTDIPIKQLADKYQFTNFSFFCQYVKQHLGMTPQKYRVMNKPVVYDS